MTIHRIVATAVLGTCLGTLSAMAAEPGVPSPATDGPVAVQGMLCVTEFGAESPKVERSGDGITPTAGGGGGLPDCPATFSVCNDVPGRKCTLQDCVTVDLGIDKCRLPSGDRLTCSRHASIHQTTCDCRERLHQICCDEGTCEFGDCGFCAGGSSAIFCQ